MFFLFFCNFFYFISYCLCSGIQIFHFFFCQWIFIQSINRIEVENLWIVRLLIGEFFSFIVSFNSYTSLNPNNRIGFLFYFENLFIISFRNRISLMNQFFVSFGKCRNSFLFSFKIVRVRKPFFFKLVKTIIKWITKNRKIIHKNLKKTFNHITKYAKHASLKCGWCIT